jgi:hypothetical protein
MADREPSAAQALYGHLKSGTPQAIEQRREPSIGDAMWPTLSRAAAQARQDTELKSRLKRTAKNLQEVLDSVRREQGR